MGVRLHYIIYNYRNEEGGKQQDLKKQKSLNIYLAAFWFLKHM